MQFPRSHLLILGVLSFGLCSFVIAKFNDDPRQARFSSASVIGAIPADKTVESVPLAPEPSFKEEKEEPVTETAAKVAEVEPEPLWNAVTSKVKPGDSLAKIFKRSGLSAQEVHRVVTSTPDGKRLRNIFPGHEFVLHVDDKQNLMKLTYSTGPLDKLVFERQGDTFSSYEDSVEPERLLAYKHSSIEHSLFVASQRAGLPDDFTKRLAQIFQWDIDFVLDIRVGDEFYVLYEEHYLNDKFVGLGQILAAEFVNQGERYQAIAYEDANGDIDYFAPDGQSMRKAFIRAPVDFSRISSNFNLRRVHPLFKTVRPHRGIDYAAPTGTPIKASGDGRVVKASRTKANGNYVVIQHGEQFETKYLHLSKFGRGIKAGAKVKQEQIIGYVGATGWATAPHLHYEFLVNGVHKNPRTVSLPDAAPIPADEMSRFEDQTKQFAALLENYKSQVAVALAR